jgi:hypothetical protein
MPTLLTIMVYRGAQADSVVYQDRNEAELQGLNHLGPTGPGWGGSMCSKGRQRMR